MATRAASLAAVFAALIGHSPARGQGGAACAKFEEPLAYNACLAKQGPRAGAIGGVRRAAGGGTVPATRGPHGRVRMEFTVTPR